MPEPVDDDVGRDEPAAARKRYRHGMPELPEVEAWVRELDPLVSRSPIEKAGPAHIATLKTFEPPLSELDGRRFEGARRRGKNLLFPIEDDGSRPPRASDERRTAALPRTGREEAEDAHVPAALHGTAASSS